eukprot:359472-Chlamydomonas_euryale.AAC.7
MFERRVSLRQNEPHHLRLRTTEVLTARLSKFRICGSPKGFADMCDRRRPVTYCRHDIMMVAVDAVQICSCSKRGAETPR